MSSSSGSSARVKVAILGSTGSIGVQALDVIARNHERFEVVGLASGGNSAQSQSLFAEQVRDFLQEEYTISANNPRAALAHFDGDKVLQIADAKRTGADIVLNGIAGNAGLEASLVALKSGAELALANKESCVIGGSLLQSAIGASTPLLERIRPVDSEHSAIWQCLTGARKMPADVARLILTASGGPFRDRSYSTFDSITPQEALAHPTWDMGKLVTVNSATMMNKGLELIEAAYLFELAPDSIEVTVHPTSEVHSFVQFQDGSTLAQCSPPDMRLPIAYALSAPMHLADVGAAVDFSKAFSWSFEPVDLQKFPALRIAKDALKSGVLYPAVMNAANESNVYAFLRGVIRFTEIVSRTQEALERFEPRHFSTDPNSPTLEEIEQIVARYSEVVV